MAILTKDFESVGGVKIAVDPSRMSKKMLAIVRDGQYERDEVTMLPPILQDGERVVELGGGLGYVSAVTALSHKIQHLAVYEANPDLIPLIKRTHELNGVTSEIINAVVMPDDKIDSARFYIRDDFWASSLSSEPWGYSRTVDVPAVSFAGMLRQHSPTMLIVDIEGGEVELFNNVNLTGVHKIFMEVHQAIIGRVGMHRLFEFMSQKDFHYDQWHSRNNIVLFSHVLRK
jgi:FkbM family methyltransferase